MPVQGNLKADELRIAQLTLDLTKSPVRMEALAAMIDSDTGDTRAWIPCRGNLWSSETQAAMRALLDSMERDVANSALQGGGSASKKGLVVPGPGGIGEHVGDGSEAEAPSM